VRVLWIGIAGFFGALARYAVEGWVSRAARGSFPWGTFAVNVSGSLALGFAFTLLAERFLPHPTLRNALTIGFLGSYTTFSTFAFESVRLAEDGAMLLAGANVAASVLAAVAGVYAGMWLGRTV
jgi:CrcB protein